MPYSALRADPKHSNRSSNPPSKANQVPLDVLSARLHLLDGKTRRFSEVVRCLYIYNIRHVMSSLLRMALALLVVAALVSAYDKIDGYN